MTARSSKTAASRKTADPPANRLLGLLPPRDYARLRPHLHRIPLEYRQSLYRANKPIDFVYFIETGVGSLVNTMGNGQAAEVGTIGNEGLVGLPIVFGDNRAPTSVYVQVPGAGLRMKAALFRKELARSASMRTVMLHYAHAFFNQVAQSAACNHFHSIDQRCCRWLLMTHDRMQSDEFLLTQEFLAMMLGVQRTGVTAAAGALQRAGLIRCLSQVLAKPAATTDLRPGASRFGGSEPAEQYQDQHDNENKAEPAAAVITGAVERAAAETAKAAEQ
jgi:CRP-like cAMP-binding protein